MSITDYFENKPGWNIEMLATDISTNVLDKAVRGVYKTESVQTLPKEWQKKYFKRVDDDCSVASDVLKKNIVFRKFNLMEDSFPFKKPFQIVFCRNVMIYFDNPTRDKLVDKYFDHIDKGGYLFIGHSESLNHASQKYRYLKPAVYQKS
jgi:chemotaxis protein methyltransferase CheR